MDAYLQQREDEAEALRKHFEATNTFSAKKLEMLERKNFRDKST